MKIYILLWLFCSDDDLSIGHHFYGIASLEAKIVYPGFGQSDCQTVTGRKELSLHLDLHQSAFSKLAFIHFRA
jgi:hypothetical protein